MRHRQGAPECNPALQTQAAPLGTACVVHLQAIENTQETSTGVAQTGGNTGHRHQQRLFQRAVLRRFLLA